MILLNIWWAEISWPWGMSKNFKCFCDRKCREWVYLEYFVYREIITGRSRDSVKTFSFSRGATRYMLIERYTNIVKYNWLPYAATFCYILTCFVKVKQMMHLELKMGKGSFLGTTYYLPRGVGWGVGGFFWIGRITCLSGGTKGD